MKSPITFNSWIRPMVWGGRRFSDYFHKLLPSGDLFGESWEISDHPLHRSVIAKGGDIHGSIRNLMEHHREEILGRSAKHYQHFPWLIKHLDANDWLSVQVHPDEEKVARFLPGEGSKTEAWFILEADPGSRIYAGLLPGIQKRDLEKAIEKGNVEDCLYSFKPSPGDFIFLPAGTVHAVGGGVLFAEIQQTSDATFRLFDWNRKDSSGKGRALHIQESLESINWNAGPVHPVKVTGYPGGSESKTESQSCSQNLVRCKYFDVDYHRQSNPSIIPVGRLQVLICLHGMGLVGSSDQKEIPFNRGDVVLLPASMDSALLTPLHGNLGYLQATLPD